MFLEALLLTTAGFWGFWALVFIGLLFCVEYERPSLATLLLIIVIAVLQVFTDYKVASWIIEAPFKFFLFIITYIGIGVVWSCLRWVFYVKSTKRRYLYAYNEYMDAPASSRSRDDKVMYQRKIQALMKPDGWSSYDYGLDEDTFRPLIKRNKSRFMLWLAYWPSSMFWTCLNDPIRRVFNHIYYSLAGHLQAYSDKIFGDVHVYTPVKKPESMNEGGDSSGPSGRAVRVGVPHING